MQIIWRNWALQMEDRRTPPHISDAFHVVFIRLISAPWIAPLFRFLRPLLRASVRFANLCACSLFGLCFFLLFVFIAALNSCFILCICYFIFVAHWLRALSPHFAIIMRLNCSCWRCHERHTPNSSVVFDVCPFVILRLLLFSVVVCAHIFSLMVIIGQIDGRIGFWFRCG